MTSPAPHLDERRLSDLVDGEGSGADREHVETCTECKARLDALQEVTRMVSSAPGVPAAKREEAVQAALAEFNNAEEEGGPEKTPSVADLDAHRAKRRRPAAIRVAAAAAAALVSIGGVSALVAETGGSSSHVASRTAGSAPRSTAGSGAAGGALPLPAAAGSSVAQLPDLGAIGNDALLIGALKANKPNSSSLGPSAFSQQAQSATSTGCQAPPAPNGGSVLVATLTWKGTPALAFVNTTPQGHTAFVESSATCKVLASVNY